MRPCYPRRSGRPGAPAAAVQTGTYLASSVLASVRCAGAVPTRIERDGATPCARANASGSPGSGGRHQQLGGPAACRHNALSTGPETLAERRAATAASAFSEPYPLGQSVRRGAPRSGPSRRPRRPPRSGGPPPRSPASSVGRASEPPFRCRAPGRFQRRRGCLLGLHFSRDGSRLLQRD